MTPTEGRAAVLRAFHQPLELEQRPLPAVEGEQVLLRVLACGVCHSDLEAIDGRWSDFPMPKVLGHEIAGEVEGEEGAFLVYGAWGCGSCASCATGDEQLCANGRAAGHFSDGGYADYVAVPSRRHLIPLDGLDPVRAAPLTDAALTSYRAVQRAALWLQPGTTAVVIGAGGLGQFAIQHLQLLFDVRVVAIDVDDAKRRLAVGLGADDALHPDEVARLTAMTVFDFVGTDQALRLAAAIMAPDGLLMHIGGAGGHLAFGLFAEVPHEVFLSTSVWGSLDDLDAVLAMARRGELSWDVEPIPLDDINEALARLRAGDVTGRLVIVP